MKWDFTTWVTSVCVRWFRWGQCRVCLIRGRHHMMMTLLGECPDPGWPAPVAGDDQCQARTGGSPALESSTLLLLLVLVVVCWSAGNTGNTHSHGGTQDQGMLGCAPVCSAPPTLSHVSRDHHSSDTVINSSESDLSKLADYRIKPSASPGCEYC